MAVALVPPAPLLRLGKILIDVVKSGKNIKGFPIPLPLPLPNPVDKDTKVRLEQDEKQVLKVAEAINCVDEHVQNIIYTMITALWDESGSLPESMTDQLKICIREKALRQDKPKQYLQKPLRRSRRGGVGY